MSTLVLNGSRELQMPSSFVDIDREEMVVLQELDLLLQRDQFNNQCRGQYE